MVRPKGRGEGKAHRHRRRTKMGCSAHTRGTSVRVNRLREKGGICVLVEILVEIVGIVEIIEMITDDNHNEIVITQCI